MKNHIDTLAQILAMAKSPPGDPALTSDTVEAITWAIPILQAAETAKMNAAVVAQVRAACMADDDESTLEAVKRILARDVPPDAEIARVDHETVAKVRELTGADDNEPTADVVERIVRAHKRMKDFFDRRGEVTFGPMHKTPDGLINVPFDDPLGIAEEIGSRMAAMVDHVGASNYVEMRFHPRRATGDDEKITVTVQRWGKKTPHDLKREAEEALGRAVDKLRAAGIEWDEPLTVSAPMIKPRSEPVDDTPWLRLDIRSQPNVMACDRCGRRQEIPEKITADMMKAMSDAFAARHKTCPPIDGPWEARVAQLHCSCCNVDRADCGGSSWTRPGDKCMCACHKGEP